MFEKDKTEVEGGYVIVKPFLKKGEEKRPLKFYAGNIASCGLLGLDKIVELYASNVKIKEILSIEKKVEKNVYVENSDIIGYLEINHVGGDVCLNNTTFREEGEMYEGGRVEFYDEILGSLNARNMKISIGLWGPRKVGRKIDFSGSNFRYGISDKEIKENKVKSDFYTLDISETEAPEIIASGIDTGNISIFGTIAKILDLSKSKIHNLELCGAPMDRNGRVERMDVSGAKIDFIEEGYELNDDAYANLLSVKEVRGLNTVKTSKENKEILKKCMEKYDYEKEEGILPEVNNYDTPIRIKNPDKPLNPRRF